MAEQASTQEHEPLVSLTPRAVEAVKQVRAKEGRPEEDALRVAVVGGGCSGFSYQLSFEQATEHMTGNGAADGDTVLEFDGVRVLVDATSAQYLQGVQIDFVSSLSGGGFKFSNPTASQTCGCGTSFAV